MTEVPNVDYDEIRQDYAYFLAHSTETAAQVAALVRHMDWVAGRAAPARLLDFGCGTGEFLARLLKVREIPAERLEIGIMEPRATLRNEAVDRLSGFARRVDAYADIDDFRGQFDLILANHCLYYVPYPEVTTRRLLNALSAGGRIVAALLDRENALAKIWKSGFELELSSFPFMLAEDLEAVCISHGLRQEREEINYRVKFPDTEVARSHVLRFLFGSHIANLPADACQALFEPFRQGGRVVLETSYPHLVVQMR